MSEVEKKEEVVEKKEEVVEKKEETTPATTTEEKKDDSEEHAKDEEPQVDFGERLKLKEQTISTNEEGEEVLYKQRSRLFRFDTTEGPQWKERGIGEVRFLKDKVTGKIRIVMRREVVLKVCLNHFVDPNLALEVMPGSDRAWTWKCPLDFADDEHPEGIAEIFAIRFGTAKDANEFKDKFTEYKSENKKILDQ